MGIVGADEQEEFLSRTDWVVEKQFAIFGSNFETILRDYFPQYTALEQQGREQGVDSKPFLARYVAEHLAVDDAPGWAGMQALAQEILVLVEG